MALLLTILIVLTISYLVSMYAEQRGRDRRAWFLLGGCFGLLALAVLFYLPPLQSEEKTPLLNKRDEDNHVPACEQAFSAFVDSQWYLIDVNHQQRGPVDSVDLQIAWDDGLVNKEGYVWREGMAEWQQICCIAGLENWLTTLKN